VVVARCDGAPPTIYIRYPAEYRVPGWKGCDRLWAWMDYSTTAESYFGQFGVHGTAHVDPEQQYLVASHPHGTVIFQRMYWRTTQFEALFKKGWRFLGASVLFRIPIVREMSLLFGAVAASRPTAELVLQSGKTLVLYPGGLDEANSLGVNSGDVRIKPRVGFCRLAVQYVPPPHSAPMRSAPLHTPQRATVAHTAQPALAASIRTMTLRPFSRSRVVWV
jgi:hypothetical protein